MISKIEANDSGFTGIWSKPLKLDCGTLYLNPKLADDLFFNKLSNVTCIDDSMIEKSIAYFQKNNTIPYVYSLNYPQFQTLLEKKGFVYHDTQHTLKKSTLPQRKPDVIKITSDTISIWTGIFCDAYDCREWSKTVSSILEKSISSVDYFVDSSQSACMALYQTESVLGLYCLGTIPSKRNHGMASLLIDFALHEVRSRHLEFLMLETYEKDNLLEFYSKLGFEKVYHKTVYTI
ncbi:MAG TPA: GNAT family N-acetyltransferase [Candidatus Nitrosotalea sp.]|nr:GNAT family N-acetyltransferase [Candidatus Nitrosotalea sp.]